MFVLGTGCLEGKGYIGEGYGEVVWRGGNVVACWCFGIRGNDPIECRSGIGFRLGVGGVWVAAPCC